MVFQSQYSVLMYISEYKSASMNKAVLQKYDDDDATPDMFPMVDTVIY